MVSELGTIVEGDAAAKLGGQGDQGGLNPLSDRGGGFAGQALHPNKAGGTLLESKDRLARLGELHGVCFPMAGG